ncbi:MAG: sulfatase-like hydrolase/transferase [Pseudomonadota bacterium]
MTKRPNYILFITDQHRADYLGCAGHPILKTPNIDSIASRGIQFDRFFVASPICMPNRASLMTSRMPANHGVRMNGLPLARQNVTFVEVLKAAGYKTALIGKSHLQTFSGKPPGYRMPPVRDGYDRPAGETQEAVRHDLSDPIYKTEDPAFWENPDAQTPTPFYGFDHVDLVTGHGDALGGNYKHWLRNRLPIAQDYMGAENEIPHTYICPQAVRTAIPPELYSTTYIAERAAAWIEEQGDDDTPFFLMVSWPDPHHPFNPPGKYWDMYDPDDMPVPEAFQRNDWTPPPHVQGTLDLRAAGKAGLGGMMAVGTSNPREAQEAQALTCGMISMIDDAVGTVQSALRVTGLAENTVEIFTSDHGDHLGDHKLLFKGAAAYDEITRVPFIWADPNGPSGVTESRLGQTIDIGTTLLEHAKIEPSWGMQGLDLFGARTRDVALIQYAHQRPMDGIGVRPHVHTVHDGRYRLSLFEGLEWGELYDLQTDPGEFANLWSDDSKRDIKLRLMTQFAQAQMAHTDKAPLPTGHA